MRRHQGGFSLLELAVVVVLVAVFYAMALSRLGGIQGQAERLAMQQVVDSIRTAMILRMVERIRDGQAHVIPEMIHENPMSWLLEQPSNYLGEMTVEQIKQALSGHWYYQADDNLLVYKIKADGGFVTTLPGDSRIRFKVFPVFSDISKTQDTANTQYSLEGLRFAEVEPYQWGQ